MHDLLLDTIVIIIRQFISQANNTTDTCVVCFESEHGTLPTAAVYGGQQNYWQFLHRTIASRSRRTNGEVTISSLILIGVLNKKLIPGMSALDKTKDVAILVFQKPQQRGCKWEKVATRTYNRRINRVTLRNTKDKI